MGLIDLLDGELNQSLKERRLVSEQEEWAMRYAAYRAVEQLQRLYGRSMEFMNTYLFPKTLSRND